MSVSDRPVPESKRQRVGTNARLSILDTPANNDIWNQGLDQAMEQVLGRRDRRGRFTVCSDASGSSWLELVISSHTTTFCAFYCVSFWLSACTSTHTQQQVDPLTHTSLPPTLRDTQIDMTPTQVVGGTPEAAEYSDHYDDFFLPSIPEGVPAFHMGIIRSVRNTHRIQTSSRSADSVFLQVLFKTSAEISVLKATVINQKYTAVIKIS